MSINARSTCSPVSQPVMSTKSLTPKRRSRKREKDGFNLQFLPQQRCRTPIQVGSLSPSVLQDFSEDTPSAFLLNDASSLYCNSGSIRCVRSLTRRPTMTARGTTQKALIIGPNPKLSASTKPARVIDATMCNWNLSFFLFVAK